MQPEPQPARSEAASPGLGGVGSRREAREQALGLLYEADRKGLAADAVLTAQPVPPHTYATRLVGGVAREQHRLDVLIDRTATNWRLDRMPTIDLLLLRLAAYELLHEPEVPTGVVLAEAVELANRFSTEESGRFVNGVLAAIADEAR